MRLFNLVLVLRLLNAIPDPNSCFPGQITSHYTGDSVNFVTGQWLDISGNNNHAVIGGSGIDVFDGTDDANESYLNNHKVLFGPATGQITFNPSLPADRTLIHLCKYRDVGRASRIIQAESYNYVSGFHLSNSGVAYDNGWVTSDTQRFKRRWVLSAQTPELYRGNGVDYTVTPRTGVPTKLTINRGYVATHTSDFACAEIILIDQILGTSQIECIENYFNEKYLLKAVNKPGGCLTNAGSLAGWYDGNSYDNVNGIWKDKSGLGYLNNVIIEGTGFGYITETVSSNELYANNQPVIYGTTATDVTFSPMLLPDHTVFSVCKYKDGSLYKRRIIQSESWNGVYGFCGGRSGVAFVKKWITSQLNRFGNGWVISTQTADLYRGNMLDFTVTTGGTIGNTRLMINKGFAGGESSDFACAEVLIFNEELQNNDILCIENYLNNKYNILPTPPTSSPIIPITVATQSPIATPYSITLCDDYSSGVSAATITSSYYLFDVQMMGAGLGGQIVSVVSDSQCVLSTNKIIDCSLSTDQINSLKDGVSLIKLTPLNEYICITDMQIDIDAQNGIYYELTDQIDEDIIISNSKCEYSYYQRDDGVYIPCVSDDSFVLNPTSIKRQQLIIEFKTCDLPNAGLESAQLSTLYATLYGKLSKTHAWIPIGPISLNHADSNGWPLDTKKTFVFNVHEDIIEIGFVAFIFDTADDNIDICIDSAKKSSKSKYGVYVDNIGTIPNIWMNNQEPGYMYFSWPICKMEEVSVTLDWDNALHEVDEEKVHGLRCANYDRFEQSTCSISRSYEFAKTEEHIQTEVSQPETICNTLIVGMSGTEAKFGATALDEIQTCVAFDEEESGEVKGESTTISVECTGEITLRQSHRQSYTLIFSHQTTTIPTKTNYKLTMCDEYVPTNNVIEKTIHLNNIDTTIVTHDTIGCEIVFETPVYIPTDQTCAELQIESFMHQNIYVPTCNENNPNLFDGCQCVIGDKWTESVCMCHDIYGNPLEDGTEIIVESAETWEETCQKLNCENSIYSSSNVPAKFIDNNKHDNKFNYNDIFIRYTPIISLVFMAICASMYVTGIINRNCKSRASKNNYQNINVNDEVDDSDEDYV